MINAPKPKSPSKREFTALPTIPMASLFFTISIRIKQMVKNIADTTSIYGIIWCMSLFAGSISLFLVSALLPRVCAERPADAPVFFEVDFFPFCFSILYVLSFMHYRIFDRKQQKI